VDARRTSTFNQVRSSPSPLSTATKNGTVSQYIDPVDEPKKYMKPTPRPENTKINHPATNPPTQQKEYKKEIQINK